MLYKNVELHNVAELLEGSARDVLSREALQRANTPPQGPWEDGSGADSDGLWLTRIPDALRRTLNPMAQMKALETAGCEMRFVREGPVRVTLRSLVRPSVVEIFQGDFHVGWQVVGTEPTEVLIEPPPNLDRLREISIREGLPFGAEMTRLILPWRPAVKLLGLEGAARPPDPGHTPRRCYLAYGSSITHGNQSVRPTAGYAARTAALLGADLVNLGFGGGAHLEPGVAEHIAARRDWDFATLEMGINLIESIEEAEFERRVQRFVDVIAQQAGGRPVFCIDLFPCRHDSERPEKIAAFREIVRRKTADPCLPHVLHVPGPELLTSSAGLTADLVHPSPHGMEMTARALSERMEPVLAG